MVGPSALRCTLLLMAGCVLFSRSTAQTSCGGRCGESYYRGHLCHCDYDCLGHGECCGDYEALCTTGGSCKGRCGESFKRGRQCDCDSDCGHFKKCCPDHSQFCRAEEYQDPPEPNPESNLPEEPDENSTTQSGNEAVTKEPSDGEILREVTPVTGGPEGPPNVEEVIGEVLIPMATTPVPEDASGYDPVAAAGHDPSDPVVTTPWLPVVDSALPEGGEQDLDGSELEEFTPLPDQDLSVSVPASTVAPSAVDQPPSPGPDSEEPSPASATPLSSTASEENNPDKILQERTPPAAITPRMTEVPATQASIRLNNQTLSQLDPARSTASSENLGTTTQGTAEPAGHPKTPGSEVGGDVPKRPDYTNPTTAAPAPSGETREPNTTPVTPTKTSGAPISKDNPHSTATDAQRDYQADDSYDTDLCSGRPASGLTALRNGTVVVFRGHYFWTLDSERVPGVARSITDVWGIPSPIDTVFTRCNCQGNTYFFKGSHYWRFKDGLMDPGFPKAITTGFDGLKGHITAALSVPAYSRRRESVFFFKRGGLVQKYTYDPAKTPTCGAAGPRVRYATLTRQRTARYAETLLGREMSIRLTWGGFPSTVTSAVSIPSRAADGYEYHVFSRTQHYAVRMDNERPALAAPSPGATGHGATSSFFKCPDHSL
ncbi:proteoglycan 4b [Denticeps clupeoides]|uniref:SMB domain-containing protein n=1 Tax=Denticeps clupeoides TaxID=299321 RepID=A0AAY4CJ80_9TELE|nr:proteoglycan 4-like [Denticeps clupeoides]